MNTWQVIGQSVCHQLSWANLNQSDLQQESATTGGACWSIKLLDSREKSENNFTILCQWNTFCSSDKTYATAAPTLNAWGAAIIVFKWTVASLRAH